MKRFLAVWVELKGAVALVVVAAVFSTGLAGCGGSTEPSKVSVPTKPGELKPGETAMPKPDIPKAPAKGKNKVKK